jgi:hypothetical protein
VEPQVLNAYLPAALPIPYNRRKPAGGCLFACCLHAPTHPCHAVRAATVSAAASYGPNGDGATCVQLAPEGGLSFTCKYCARPGLQPFAEVDSVSFWLNSDAQTSDARIVATPRGQVCALEWSAVGVGQTTQRAQHTALAACAAPSWVLAPWVGACSLPCGPSCSGSTTHLSSAHHATHCPLCRPQTSSSSCCKMATPMPKRTTGSAIKTSAQAGCSALPRPPAALALVTLIRKTTLIHMHWRVGDLGWLLHVHTTPCSARFKCMLGAGMDSLLHACHLPHAWLLSCAGNVTPVATAAGGWFQFSVALADFQCDYEVGDPLRA